MVVCLAEKFFVKKKFLDHQNWSQYTTLYGEQEKRGKKNFRTIIFLKIFRFCWFLVTMALKDKENLISDSKSAQNLGLDRAMGNSLGYSNIDRTIEAFNLLIFP